MPAHAGCGRRDLLRAIVALCLLLPAAAWAQSPFVGAWRGTWRDGRNGQEGPVALSVDELGGVNGQVGNRALGSLSPLSGHVEPDGLMELTYTYDGGVTFMRAYGRMRYTRDGRLIGPLDFIFPNGRRLGRGMFVLDRAPRDGGG